MTLPDERTRAVLEAKRFLYALIHREMKGSPSAVREKARRILKHYPSEFDMVLAAEKAPDIFGKVPASELLQHLSEETK